MSQVGDFINFNLSAVCAVAAGGESAQSSDPFTPNYDDRLTDDQDLASVISMITFMSFNMLSECNFQCLAMTYAHKRLHGLVTPDSHSRLFYPVKAY